MVSPWFRSVVSSHSAYLLRINDSVRDVTPARPPELGIWYREGERRSNQYQFIVIFKESL